MRRAAKQVLDWIVGICFAIAILVCILIWFFFIAPKNS